MIDWKSASRRLRMGAVALAALLVFVVGYRIGSREPAPPAPGELAQGAGALQGSGGSSEPAKAKSSLYVCPMMDVPPMSQPGKCPVCGMELVEVSGGGVEEQGPPRVALTGREVELAGIQVAPVERKIVSAEVWLYGQVEYDPGHVKPVSVYMPCIIQRVYVQRPGVQVSRDTPLFDVYSPELYFTEQELLEAVRRVPGYLASQRRGSQLERMVPPEERNAPKAGEKEIMALEAIIQKLTNIRYKLGAVGSPDKDGIEEISNKYVDNVIQNGAPIGVATVYALRDGLVIEQKAVEGTYVNTANPLVSIANPRFVWVQLDAYESDYLWIKYKQRVRFWTDAYPGEVFHGTVAFIDPVFDSNKRTFRVGVIFNDTMNRLKPQMFVRAVIESQLAANDMVRGDEAEVSVRELEADRGSAPLVVPATAPLITGKRAVVYVQVPGQRGVYEGREVLLGPRAKDYYLVRSGLTAGELVVVNGAFKIDSAVQILARQSMMQWDEAAEPPAAPAMPAHEPSAHPAAGHKAVRGSFSPGSAEEEGAAQGEAAAVVPGQPQGSEAADFPTIGSEDEEY